MRAAIQSLRAKFLKQASQPALPACSSAFMQMGLTSLKQASRSQEIAFRRDGILLGLKNCGVTSPPPLPASITSSELLAMGQPLRATHPAAYAWIQELAAPADVTKKLSQLISQAATAEQLTTGEVSPPVLELLRSLDRLG